MTSFKQISILLQIMMEGKRKNFSCGDRSASYAWYDSNPNEKQKKAQRRSRKKKHCIVPVV